MAFKYSYLKVLLVFLIFELGAAFTTPVWAHFIEHLGGDIRRAGEAILVYSATISIIGIFFSLIYSRLPIKKYLYPLSLILSALGFFCYSLITSINQLYALQIYLGLVGAIQPPAFSRIYENMFENNPPELPWGIYDCSWIIVVGLGSFASSYLVYHYGFDIMFYCMSFLCLSAIPVYLVVTRNQVI